MPSAFTSTVKLEKPANGEQDSTWGDTVNANMDRIDAAFASVGNRAVTQSAAGTTSWTVPDGVFAVSVIVVGGGGGGAPSNGQTTSSNSSGGGGGAGGMATGFYTVTPGQIISVTVGAGGATQQNGGTSSFGNFCSASGGGGSNFATALNSPGGVGGQPSGGNVLNLFGGRGSDGQFSSYTGMGNGAPGPFGGGGTAAPNGNLPNPGCAPGAGGGGSYFAPSLTVGASGAAGMVAWRY